MKKTLVALAAVAATSAFAQATITGGVQVGMYKAAVASGGSSNYVLDNPQNSRTNVTFSSTEDLGGGMKFGFMTQLRLGSENALATYRTDYFEQVKTSISGGFGTLAVGRFSLDNAQEGFVRIMGDDGAMRSYGGLAWSRDNGQIQYTSPTMGGLRVNLVSIPAASGGTNASQVGVVYQAGKVNAYAAHTSKYAGNDQNVIGGSYDFGMAVLKLGTNTLSPTSGAADTKETGIGVEIPAGKALKVGVQTTKVTKTGAADKTLNAFQAVYALSKRTNAVFQVKTETGKTTASFIGMNSTF